MADDKAKRELQDRNNVAAAEPYEVDYEAKKLGITPAQLKAIIVQVGIDRAKIEKAARSIPSREPY